MGPTTGRYRTSAAAAAAGRSRTTAGWRSPHSCPACCDTAGRGQASDAPGQTLTVHQPFIFLTNQYCLTRFIIINIIITCVFRVFPIGGASWFTLAPPSLRWGAGESFPHGAALGCLLGVFGGGPDFRGLILTPPVRLGVWGRRRRTRLLQPSSADSWTAFSFLRGLGVPLPVREDVCFLLEGVETGWKIQQTSTLNTADHMSNSDSFKGVLRGRPLSPCPPLRPPVPSGTADSPWLGSQPEVETTTSARCGGETKLRDEVEDVTLHLVKSLTELGPNFTCWRAAFTKLSSSAAIVSTVTGSGRQKLLSQTAEI